MGSIPTLVRVFLCPLVALIPLVGLTLTWFTWVKNGTLHYVTIVNSVQITKDLKHSFSQKSMLYNSQLKWCIYIAPLSQTSQRRFTMINLPPADWKHIQAQMAAASKQSMHAGTQLR